MKPAQATRDFAKNLKLKKKKIQMLISRTLDRGGDYPLSDSLELELCSWWAVVPLGPQADVASWHGAPGTSVAV